MSGRGRVGRLVAAGLGLALLAACGSSTDAGTPTTSSVAATGAPSSAAATATGALSQPRATTVVAGDPTVPLLSGNVGDLATMPTLTAATAPAPSGLIVSDVVEGTGQVAKASSTVGVRYVGALYQDGTVFDSSWKRGDAPTSFPLSKVVPGFAAGIEGMAVGGRREIVIPPALGYGDTTKGPIPGGSTLVFVVDLVTVS